MERDTGRWGRRSRRGGREGLAASLLVLAACLAWSPGAGAGPPAHGDTSWRASDLPWPCYRGEPVTATGRSARTAFEALLEQKYARNCGGGCTGGARAPQACEARYVFQRLADPLRGFAAGRIRFHLRYRRTGDPPGTWRGATAAFVMTPGAEARAGADVLPAAPAGTAHPEAPDAAPCTLRSIEPRESPLAVSRCFSGGGDDGGFGAGWRSTLLRRLQPDWLHVHAVRGTGRVLHYVYGEGGWQSAHDGAPRLRAWRGGWRLEHAAGGYEYYDAEGLLAMEREGESGATVYQRDARGRLEAVIGPAGRRLHVLRDDTGRIAALADPIGGSCRYRYGTGGRLLAAHCSGQPQLAYRYEAGGGAPALSRHAATAVPHPAAPDPGSIRIAENGAAGPR